MATPCQASIAICTIHTCASACERIISADRYSRGAHHNCSPTRNSKTRGTPVQLNVMHQDCFVPHPLCFPSAALLQSMHRAAPARQHITSAQCNQDRQCSPRRPAHPPTVVSVCCPPAEHVPHALAAAFAGQAAVAGGARLCGPGPAAAGAQGSGGEEILGNW